jgi:hypothetical protein
MTDDRLVARLDYALGAPHRSRLDIIRSASIKRAGLRRGFYRCARGTVAFKTAIRPGERRPEGGAALA